MAARPHAVDQVLSELGRPEPGPRARGPARQRELRWTSRRRDYEYPGGPSTGLGTLAAVFTGVGPFQHNDPRDRPLGVFGKKVTIHCGPGRASHVLLPIIPPAR